MEKLLSRKLEMELMQCVCEENVYLDKWWISEDIYMSVFFIC
jgi:hypothetical protein